MNQAAIMEMQRIRAQLDTGSQPAPGRANSALSQGAVARLLQVWAQQFVG